jgi:hypothetical protein
VQALSDEQQPVQSAIQSSDFYQLRKHLTGLLGDANKEITVVSEFLTDGNIATALYLAKYRKVDVKVFLAKAKSKRYLSRYDYLSSQGVPVYFRPQNFPFKAKTLLKIDNNLYEIDRDLDILKPSLSASIKLIAKKWVGYFDESIIKATQSKVNKTLPQPPAPLKKQQTPLSDKTNENNTPKNYANEPSGAYNYDEGSGAKKRAPDGIARKLPKTPVYVKKKLSTKKKKLMTPPPKIKNKGEQETKQKQPSIWIGPQQPQKSDDHINLEDIFDEQNNNQ